MLTGLKDRLLAPDLVAEFVGAVQEELQAAQKRRKRDDRQRSRKRAEVEGKIAGMMRAIEDGLYEPAMKQRLAELKAELASLDTEPESPALVLDLLVHPNLPELYRRKVAELERVLEGPDRAEAMDLIRSMIEKVELVPSAEGKGLEAKLYGDLAVILAACEGAKTSKLPGAGERPGSQLSVV